MTNKKRKDTFGNGLIAFLFICMIFLMGYAFKNPILLYSTNPEVEINHTSFLQSNRTDRIARVKP